MGKRKKARFTVSIEVESLEIIDFYADKLQQSRAEVVKALLNLALDNQEIMNAIGVFRMDSLRERGVIVQLPLGYYE
jgi:metal-responsive CopG/Arc/MetJ family transcriptional regulator